MAFAATTTSLLVSCAADDSALLQGEGRVALTATLSGDLKVVSRADAEELRELYGESLKLWLTKPGSGPVRQYEGIDNLPADPIALPAGSYIAEAWAGDSVNASFDKKYFKAFDEFTVTTGQTEQVTVNCKIANSVVSVQYADEVDEVLSNYTLEAANKKGSVVFEGRDERKGYFMMPKNDTDIVLTLTGTTLDGKTYTQTATIADVKPATEYAVKIKPGSSSIDIVGGVYFDIEVDATEIDVEDTFVITLAPQIKGIGFDINQPVSGEEGKVGRKSIYITATEELGSVILDSEALSAYLDGFTRLDLLKASQTYIDQLAEAGITLGKITDDEGRLTNLRVNFEEAYTNKLTNGTYQYSFTAADEYGSNEATFTIEITDAPIATMAVDPGSVSYTSVTLRANVMKIPQEIISRAATLGFNYRAAGAAEWTFVEGTLEGSTLTAAITGLKNDTSYEYQAVYDDFAGSVMSFATLAYPQLPNASFEEWCKSGKIQLVCASEDQMWWDSGNHGSATMSVTLTQPSTKYVKSGKYSAELKSQYVGMLGIGAFAAGNLFTGHFLGTENTTKGILGWGRPFDFKARPTALTGYVRYEPGTVNNKGAGSHLSVGDRDRGIIYIALLTDDLETQGDGTWPVEIRTKGPKLFDENAANVVAYGKIEFDGPTAGDGLIPFTIPITPVNSSLSEYYIMIVASASYYGDYYEGGEGSTMWLDDLHLEY